jgi:hypothetical protein
MLLANAVDRNAEKSMTAIKVDAIVGDGGRLELSVGLPAGTAVEVLVREPQPIDQDDLESVEWDDQLQQRLDALDRGEVDPRPWREALDEIRARLASRITTP